MTGDQDLLFERREAVAVVTFNRPAARNALTFAMYDALHERCEQADADDDVRVLVLRGAGGQAFAAGTDIGEFRAFRSAQDGLAYERAVDRVVGRLEAVRKPTVAAMEGHVAGAGLLLAAACDLRLCTQGACFAMPIARTLGNCLSMANYARLAALIGPARTKELVFTARGVPAREALAWGLATQVVAPCELDAALAELCRHLAGHAPITLQVTKEALRRLRPAGPSEGDDLVAQAYGSEDFRRAVADFGEKRRPTWRGR